MTRFRVTLLASPVARGSLKYPRVASQFGAASAGVTPTPATATRLPSSTTAARWTCRLKIICCSPARRAVAAYTVNPRQGHRRGSPRVRFRPTRARLGKGDGGAQAQELVDPPGIRSGAGPRDD